MKSLSFFVFLAMFPSELIFSLLYKSSNIFCSNHYTNIKTQKTQQFRLSTASIMIDCQASDVDEERLLPSFFGLALVLDLWVSRFQLLCISQS